VTQPDPTQPRRVLKSTAPTDPLYDEFDPDHDRRRA
jgi:hypothetical protein